MAKRPRCPGPSPAGVSGAEARRSRPQVGPGVAAVAGARPRSARCAFVRTARPRPAGFVPAWRARPRPAGFAPGRLASPPVGGLVLGRRARPRSAGFAPVRRRAHPGAPPQVSGAPPIRIRHADARGVSDTKWGRPPGNRPPGVNRWAVARCADGHGRTAAVRRWGPGCRPGRVGGWSSVVRRSWRGVGFRGGRRDRGRRRRSARSWRPAGSPDGWPSGCLARTWRSSGSSWCRR